MASLLELSMRSGAPETIPAADRAGFADAKIGHCCVRA
jgi:hypothetical protein